MSVEIEHLGWPFFTDAHRELAARARAWAQANLGHAAHAEDRASVDARCRELVRALGDAGLTRYCVRRADGGALEDFEARAICLLRETLAARDGLADFAFAMQGLGSGSISLAGSAGLRARYLPQVATGRAIAAFALSEPDAGSDVAAMSTSARRDGGDYVLDGGKTWISNGGIADFYCVFARTSPPERRADGSVAAKGISAFVVEPGDPGFSIAERIDVVAPHPLARLAFDGCRVPADRLIGAEGEGFKIAMRTLDVFRTSVAAAALGFARHALRETLVQVQRRKLFGAPLAALQLTQGTLADMALEVDAAALLVYRAAWGRDLGHPTVTRDAAMAKLYATEAAQRVIDQGLQLHGGQGVVHGSPLETLYREIRSLRIYEGASEVQKVLIARQVLAQATTE
jgi:acyl-CoA dehydrogenase